MPATLVDSSDGFRSSRIRKVAYDVLGQQGCRSAIAFRPDPSHVSPDLKYEWLGQNNPDQKHLDMFENDH